MNWDRIEGNWKQLRREALAGCLRNTCGVAKEEAGTQIGFEADRNQWVQ